MLKSKKKTLFESGIYGEEKAYKIQSVWEFDVAYNVELVLW